MSNNYSSFFGGRRGASFVITASYPTIKEMITAFKGGIDYLVVGFDDYVIIDTVNKNHVDNGKVFRRGYDYTNEQGGAIYVGQIVGPTGPAPHISLTTIDEVKKKQQELKNNQEYNYQMSSGDYTPLINLIPGKTSEGIFNDKIDWACCSVRDKDNRDTTAYIGFKIPYTVIDYTANSVSSYYNRDNQTSNFKNLNLVDRTDDKTHPFYEKWNISVPKGIKGDTFKNFRIVNASSVDKVENYPNQNEDRKGKTTSSIDSNKQRQILVYDYYSYDREASGEPKSLYLGDYNMISGVQLDDNGTLHISYNHNDDTVYNKKIQWIDSVILNENNGQFHIDYNNGKTFDTTLSWINNVEIQTDGSVDFRYVDDVNKNKLIHIDKKIQWINNILLDIDGTLTVQYNNSAKPTVFNKKIKWIDNITLSDNGTLAIKYNNEIAEKPFIQKLRWITSCTFDEQGNFKLTFNDGTAPVTQKIKWIKDLQINTGVIEGDGDQKLKVTYNNGTVKPIGNPINYIIKTALTDDFHLIVLYSDPEKRKAIVQAGKGYTHENRNDWYDLGQVRGYDGILIGMNISLEKNPNLVDQSLAISYLNSNYSMGLTGEMTGKLVSIGYENKNKDLYAFNYNKIMGKYKGWYYLGTVGLDEGSFTVISENTMINEKQAIKELKTSGIWFIEEV